MVRVVLSRLMKRGAWQESARPTQIQELLELLFEQFRQQARSLARLARRFLILRNGDFRRLT